MHISPNNKLSNHYRRKKLRKVGYTFTEDYDYQIYAYPDNAPNFLAHPSNILQTNSQHFFSSLFYDNPVSQSPSNQPENIITPLNCHNALSLGQADFNLLFFDDLNNYHSPENQVISTNLSTYGIR